MEHTQDPPPDERAFEFPLDDRPDREPLHADAVTEFFRQQLMNLLDVIVPSAKGQPVKVDGFAFLRDPTRVYPLWPDCAPRDEEGGIEVRP